jgi:hypothetical protein
MTSTSLYHFYMAFNASFMRSYHASSLKYSTLRMLPSHYPACVQMLYQLLLPRLISSIRSIIHLYIHLITYFISGPYELGHALYSILFLLLAISLVKTIDYRHRTRSYPKSSGHVLHLRMPIPENVPALFPPRY